MCIYKWNGLEYDFNLMATKMSEILSNKNSRMEIINGFNNNNNK